VVVVLQRWRLDTTCVHDTVSMVMENISLIKCVANGRPERRDDGRERRPRGG
jgi:hypothetical protein